MSQSYAKSPAAERKFTTREMVLVGMLDTESETKNDKIEKGV